MNTRKLEGLELFLFSFGNRGLTPREKEMSEWYGKLHSELQSALREVERLTSANETIAEHNQLWVKEMRAIPVGHEFEIDGDNDQRHVDVRQAIDNAMKEEK